LPDILYGDFETKSLLDLSVVGLDRYAKDPSTHPLMFAWAVNDGPVNIWFPDQKFSNELTDALHNPDVIKVAWNAPFERAIFKYPLKLDIHIQQWLDPQILAHHLSMPGKLEQVGEILKMPPELRKADGDDLIKLFSMPARDEVVQTLFGPLDRFNDQHSHPKEWATFVEYCKQDVVAERALFQRMIKLPLPFKDWQGWYLDQKMNEYGMPVSMEHVRPALRLAMRNVTEMAAQLKEMTGLENPNSDQKMKEWITLRGYDRNSMKKEEIQTVLNSKDSKLTDECRKVLLLRKQFKRASYNKLKALQEQVSEDFRLRHQFKYMAAARTARWASYGVQVQNLFRPDKKVAKHLEYALELIRTEDYDALVRECGAGGKFEGLSVVGVVISCLRSYFQAPRGRKFAVCDLNAIENRVLGWIARCPAILEVFQKKDSAGRPWCPYLAFGCKMYKMDYEAIAYEYYVEKKGEKRQNSKPAVLGAGYGLGGGELKKNQYGDWVRGGLWGYALAVCGVDMPQELAHESVEIFRDSYIEVVNFWNEVEYAFKETLRTGRVMGVGCEPVYDTDKEEWVPDRPGPCLIFSRRKMGTEGECLVRLRLPSGRHLHYLQAWIAQEEYTIRKGPKAGQKRMGEVIYYAGIEHSETQNEDGSAARKKAVWVPNTKTYGGKLTENIVQAISRDLLVNAMLLADSKGLEIFGVFHDEIAVEADEKQEKVLDTLRECMVEIPDWAPGLLLGAEGYEAKVYRKD
jgi:DNA polymerase bacteriophage-type